MIDEDTLNDTAGIASLVDHTLLKPEATESDIQRLCAEALQFSFASVCINPCWVGIAAEAVSGSQVRVCTVSGFPLGANETRTKIAEAETALLRGARELDMVQNIGALLTGNYRLVRGEIAAVAELAHSRGALLKVILETSLLNEEQKIMTCRLAVEASADFVKTSTGFSTAGASVKDIRLMRSSVGDSLGVKASGGIRTLSALREMVRAGATRIGTSSGVHILRELETE